MLKRRGHLVKEEEEDREISLDKLKGSKWLLDGRLGSQPLLVSLSKAGSRVKLIPLKSLTR